MTMAHCLTCDALVEADDEQCRLNIRNEWECPCPFDEAGPECGGYDPHADDLHNDPRHEPYSNLRR